MRLNKLINPKKKNSLSDPFIIQEGRFKNGTMNSDFRSDWSEDVYISDKNQKETVGNNFNFSKINIVSILLFFALSLLVGKIAWLQVVKGDYYYQMAEGNRIRVERMEPKRGVIYDSKMRPLVRNRANFMLYVIPSDLPLAEEDLREGDYVALEPMLHKISDILVDISYEDIRAVVKSVNRYSFEAFRPLFIDDNIEYEKAMMLYLESANWPGVILSSKTNREYLYTGVPVYLDENKKEEDYLMSLSHLMGYTGKISQKELDNYGDEYLPIDYIGKMGIEYFWENELKGVGGRKQIEVDAMGKEKKIISQQEAIDGNNLVLSIDIEAQLKLEEIILKTLNQMGLGKGSAVVLDPSNGEVIAMVSIPAYNNNAFARGITQDEYNILINHPDKPLFNRAVSGEFPSGSTFKPVVAAAALQERLISENTTFLSTGGLRIGKWFFPDWLAGGHGRTNVRRAISQSVNTFFYYIGGGYDDFTGLGVDRVVRYAAMFGLGSQTGIDLAGEAGGLLPTRDWKWEAKGESWYIGDTYHLAIGQGDLLATPLQVALFTSVFANGGSLYRPHFIRQILDGEDKIIKENLNEAVREGFIDPYNMEVVRSGMRQTVTQGSGRRLSTLNVTSAGKTGTAQWSSVKDNHAWYTGFAPYDNPDIAFAILIEEGIEGSTAAVPVAKEFLEWYFRDSKQ